MSFRFCLCAVIGGLLSCVWRAGANARIVRRFNGLDMNLGNLSRLSDAQSALDQRGELYGRKGQGGHGHRRHRPRPRARVGPRLESLPLGCRQGQIHLHAGRDRGIGGDPADLDDAGRPSTRPGCTSSASIGTARPSRRSKCRWATSSPAAGASTARSTRCRSASIPAARSTATGPCPSARRPRSPWRTSTTSDMTLYYQINYTLTDVPDDAAYFHAQFRRVNQAAGQERLHDPRRRPRPGTIRGHLSGLGSPQSRLVGRRAKSSSTWTATRSFPRSAAPAPKTTSAARTTSRTRRRIATRRSARPTRAWPRCCRRT